MDDCKTKCICTIQAVKHVQENTSIEWVLNKTLVYELL